MGLLTVIIRREGQRGDTDNNEREAIEKELSTHLQGTIVRQIESRNATESKVVQVLSADLVIFGLFIALSELVTAPSQTLLSDSQLFLYLVAIVVALSASVWFCFQAYMPRSISLGMGSLAVEESKDTSELLEFRSYIVDKQVEILGKNVNSKNEVVNELENGIWATLAGVALFVATIAAMFSPIEYDISYDFIIIAISLAIFRFLKHIFEKRRKSKV